MHRFIAFGDMAKDLANLKREVTNIKITNTWLREENKCLQDEATYYKEVVAVQQATSQGSVA